MTDLDAELFYNLRYLLPAMNLGLFFLMEIKSQWKKQTIQKTFKKGLLVDKRS